MGASESNFQRVHDNGFISSDKRLYMTATPRIYGDRAKRKANENLLTIASMDDESKYGPEFHRLGFGQASDLGILSPYKVVIFNVDMEQVGIDLEEHLADESSPINMSNAASMVGCWNGLRKRGASGFDFSSDPQPVRRAVAFSNRIKDSELFEGHFPRIVESCIAAEDENGENLLQCQVHHVDGTQNALERSNHLSWLRQEPAPGTCSILSNARCLTEGIDVPALDAILFLHPRKSEIDVVQAVGRVMRKAKGKEFGYIILPIAQAPNATAEDTLKSSAYKAVWQVINAISAHDDRFEAQINQLALVNPDTGPKPDNGGTEEGGIGIDGPADGGDDSGGIQGTLPLIIAGSIELRDAILARIVDKYADPGYWEKWATDVRGIAERHEARIRALLNGTDSHVRPIFVGFLTGLRQNLNDGITEDDAIGMLSQHLVTKPVFDALFEDYTFAQSNPVSQAMESTLESLQERGLEKETEGLENFYRDVRVCVQGVTDAASKQRIIAELYQRFFRLALPETHKNLGIVYTPIEVVDYTLRSVEDVLEKEFGVSITNEGVHVIDPFVGTGTFMSRLLRSGLVKPEHLKRKYESELHANDIMLLAYYVAAVNIESTYHELVEAEEYNPFNGIVLTDTFQSYEEDDPMDEVLFPQNNDRIEHQKGLDIRVILGNPPWSATNTRKYPSIDRRIRDLYSKRTATKNVVSIYDPYVRAIRQASDRVQSNDKGGIVAFVTNGGFIDSNAFDGFRKALSEEFHAIYCYNLRGDQRTAGEQSRLEGGKIFGSGSRARVAILLLVKRPGKTNGATIHYQDIGDRLTREQKLDILKGTRLTTDEWRIITPNEHGDWLDHRNESFQQLVPLSVEKGESRFPGNGESPAGIPIFLLRTPGLKTNRDDWCFNSGKLALQSSSSRLVEELAGAIADNDFRVSAYRPFQKRWLNFNRSLIARVRQIPELFPLPQHENYGISIAAPPAGIAFHALMTNVIPDQHLTGDTFFLPRYRYIPARMLTDSPDTNNPEFEQISNINPKALTQFRQQYGASVTEDDIFYYTYGVLHSSEWRETFSNDLAKMAARIPWATSSEDFHSLATAGRTLANLHVNYETVEPYPLEEMYANGWSHENADAYRIEKMSYAGHRPNIDTTRIAYNTGITLAGIPTEAQSYRLGSRSALDWLIERYQVRTKTKSGVPDDPNDWATEHGTPRYIIDLIKRITTVSVKTVEIVNGLPQLPI